MEPHPARRTHAHRIPKRILDGRNGKRPKSTSLRGDQPRGRHACRPTRTDLVDVAKPLPELRREVVAIVEPTDQEELVLTNPTRFSTAPFSRPDAACTLRGRAVVEDDLTERLVPVDVSPCREITTVFGLSKTHRGAPPERVEGGQERSDERSLLLVGASSTCIHRDHFSRRAKKWTISTGPSSYRTRTLPKSFWQNSPATPSKRTMGEDDGLAVSRGPSGRRDSSRRHTPALAGNGRSRRSASSPLPRGSPGRPPRRKPQSADDPRAVEPADRPFPDGQCA